MSDTKGENTTSTKGQNRQYRKFQLTQNNPEQHGLTAQTIREKVLAMEGIQYACGCEELSDTGTPHIHVFFFAPGKKRFSVLKKMFPKAHIEAAYGSCLENRAYIEKSGKWEDDHKADTKVEGSFWEYGMLPSERAEKEPEMAAIMEMLEDGATTPEIVKEYPKYALRTRRIDELKETLQHATYDRVVRDVTVTYIVGPEIVDKFAIICSRHEMKNVFRLAYYPAHKQAPSFDAYNGQSVMVFDHFRGQIPLDTMLYLLSKYPVKLPARYMDKTACYSNVYILSDVFPEELSFKPSYVPVSYNRSDDNDELNLSDAFNYELQRYEQFFSLISSIIEVDAHGNIIREEDYHYEPACKIGASHSDNA